MKKQEIVRTIKCPYEAYKYFCTKFGRDPALELKDMRKDSLDQDDDSPISEPENDTPESDTDCSSQEEEEDEAKNIIKSQIARMRVNMMSNKVEERRLCECQYGNSCIKLVLDSGCTRHITNLKVQQPTPCDKITIFDATGKSSFASTKGIINVQSLFGDLQLTNVLECKDIDGTLLSVRQLMREGYKIKFKIGRAELIKDERSFHFKWSRKEGLYILHSKLIDHSNTVQCNIVQRSSTVTRDQLLHYRFGHFGTGYLNRAGLRVGSNFKHFCPGCATEKSTKKPKKKEIDNSKTNTYVPTGRYEVLCMDTFGPIKESKKKNKYFVILICQYTGYLTGIALPSKSNIGSRIIFEMKKLGKFINKKLKMIKVIKSDQGTEYKNKQIARFCDKEGIGHNFSSPYTPSENGRAERAVRTVKTVMKNLLISSQLSSGFWDMAAEYAIQIVNVLPKPGNMKSPHELFFKKKPQLDRFHIFGARGYAVRRGKTSNLKRNLHKESIKIRFMGFSENSKQYKIWNILSKKFEEVRDIELDERSLIVRSLSNFSKGFNVDEVHNYFDAETDLLMDNPKDKKQRRHVSDDNDTDMVVLPSYSDELVHRSPIPQEPDHINHEPQLPNFCDINPDNTSR